MRCGNDSAWINGDTEKSPARPWRSGPDPPCQAQGLFEHRCLGVETYCNAPSFECSSKRETVREEAWQKLSTSAEQLAERVEGLRTARAKLASSEAPTHEIIQQLETSGDDKFAGLCTLLARRVPLLAPAEARQLADALLALMPQTLPSPTCRRYWPLVSLMELFCASRQCMEALPAKALRHLLGDLREHAAYCSWMRCLDGWGERLQMADCASASLLGSISPAVASSLLRDLHLCPSELTDCPVLAECVDRLRGSGDDDGTLCIEVDSHGVETAAEETQQAPPSPVPQLDLTTVVEEAEPLSSPSEPPSVPRLDLGKSGKDVSQTLYAPRLGVEALPVLNMTPRASPQPSPREGPEEEQRNVAKGRARRRKRRSNMGA
mmetsp:Transcript_92082/g.214012  ORF Transcript_92082/g.214012 Transcript_92082/m.214012 type:complete len:379 (+) Transcript_92082:550-1686(+)